MNTSNCLKNNWETVSQQKKPIAIISPKKWGVFCRNIYFFRGFFLFAKTPLLLCLIIERRIPFLLELKKMRKKSYWWTFFTVIVSLCWTRRWTPGCKVWNPLFSKRNSHLPSREWWGYFVSSFVRFYLFFKCFLWDYGLISVALARSHIHTPQNGQQFISGVLTNTRLFWGIAVRLGRVDES